LPLDGSMQDFVKRGILRTKYLVPAGFFF